jgi:transposase
MQRQAAPFAKRPPKTQPKKTGRKPGDDYGTQAHRPPPEHIDEYYDASLPAACPHCGSSNLHETEVAPQYQTEIPRQPSSRQFDVHVVRCCGCGQRVQGHHPLQTSDALGEAGSQLGPDAQAAIVALIGELGLSHGKMHGCLHTLFGIDLSRSSSGHTSVRVANRYEPPYQKLCHQVGDSGKLFVNEPVGEWASRCPGFMSGGTHAGSCCFPLLFFVVAAPSLCLQS